MIPAVMASCWRPTRSSPDFRRSDFSIEIGDIDRDGANGKSLRGGAFSLTELSVDVVSI